MSRTGPGAVRDALPAALQPLVDRLAGAAESAGAGLFLVGGPVRDWLLGRPLRDVDLIVDPPPSGGVDAASLAAAAAGPAGRVVRHDRFLTAQLVEGGVSVDVATVRAERYAAPGALPEVRPGTLEEDLLRRDFTVNALAVPLNAAARRGRPAVVDPGRGLEDLAARSLRVFHARSFHDDPTRALRAARLAPRLGMTVSRGSRAALRAALRDGAFGGVSGNRLRAEIEKLFGDAAHGLDPARALRWLSEAHVLAALEPGLHLPAEAAAPLRRLGRLVAEPPVPVRRARPWVGGLMLWLAPLDASLRRRALRRLAVQGALVGKVSGFAKDRDRALRALTRTRGRGATDAVLQAFDDDALLALAAATGSGLRRRIERYARDDRGVRLPIDGDDLVAIGLAGPAVGRALAQVRVAWLDRAVKSRDEALALAGEIARRSRARRPRRR